MANSTMASLTIVLVLLHSVTTHTVHLQALAAFQNKQYSILRYVLEDDEYHILYEGVDDLATKRSNFLYDRTRVLLAQTGATKEPPEWILVDLVGRDGATTTLALRSDNLNLRGFTNFAAQWYAFEGSEKLIPGSIKLDGINGSYASVGGYENILDLPLGKMSALLAVEKLLACDHTSNEVSQSDLKDALAKILLIVCEGSRFKNLSDIITMGWDTQSYVPAEIWTSLTSWSEVCGQLLKGWPNNIYTRRLLKRFPEYVKSRQDLLHVLHVMVIPLEFSNFDVFRLRNNTPPQPLAPAGSQTP